LSDLSGIWAEDVESYNTVVVSSVNENLAIAIASFWSRLVILPFKRLEFLMISKNIFSSEFCFGSFFIISATSILIRSENSSWNIDIVHFIGGSSKESLRKKHTSFDSNWSKLKHSVDNITDSINVFNVGLFNIINLKFTVLFASNTCSRKVDAFCDSVSSDSK